MELWRNSGAAVSPLPPSPADFFSNSRWVRQFRINFYFWEGFNFMTLEKHKIGGLRRFIGVISVWSKLFILFQWNLTFTLITLELSYEGWRTNRFQKLPHPPPPFNLVHKPVFTCSCDNLGSVSLAPSLLASSALLTLLPASVRWRSIACPDIKLWA